MQAHQCVIHARQEYIPDLLEVHEKVPVLIEALLVASLFRTRVFPLCRVEASQQTSSVRPYMLLYHEVLLANFLEIVLHSGRSVVLAGGDALVDLYDWCYERMLSLRTETYILDAPTGVSFNSPYEDVSEKEESPIQQILRQEADLSFRTAMCAVGVTRALCQSLRDLPLGVASRVLGTKDVIPLLCSLLLGRGPRGIPCYAKEGTKKGKRVSYHFSDGRWQEYGSRSEARFKIVKQAGQMWLCLCALLMDGEMINSHPGNDSVRRTALQDLKGIISDNACDQIPILKNLRAEIEKAAVTTAESTPWSGHGNTPYSQYTEESSEMPRRALSVEVLPDLVPGEMVPLYPDRSLFQFVPVILILTY
ncbi:hypothetical protein KIPB_003439 [Kipferlia bialata]|uniref:Uncharacterized protein n=1 Tax=Kipferlia bialata TaxID=797122 RepID=A0A9K3CS82_9EUKA|nr:hypothetical protein KIPB_003439 [Kipferlia bialata]|eukprot:g3439.t1